MNSDLLICYFQSSALKMRATDSSETTTASLTPHDAISEKTLTIKKKRDTRYKYYGNKTRENYRKQPLRTQGHSASLGTKNSVHAGSEQDNVS